MKKLMKTLSTVLVVAIVVLAVGLVGARFLGFEVYTVLSGSMEPTYETGSVVWVRHCGPSEVKVGDPITFVLNEDLVVATHRVVKVDQENGQFTTKGDANVSEDGSPVLFENLIGKPMLSIPKLGYFVSFIQKPPGMYVAIGVVAILVLLVFLPDILFKDKDDEEEGRASRSGKKAREPVGKHAR